MSAKKSKLRVITYMCPSHPVELYELLIRYLEEELNCEGYLLYESRNTGPLPDRVDPFTDNIVDIAFMSTSAYIHLLEEKNPSVELLPIAAVFNHPKNTDGTKGYYADIIIHVDGKKHVKEFLDLRGCTLAYSNDNSLSGCKIILRNLKQLGENASFFGNTLKSDSHLNSIQMVLSKQAEAASVDANTLAYNKKNLQDGGKDIIVLDSIGPLPPHPVIVNSNIDVRLKEKLIKAFLTMADKKLWGTQLKNFGIQKFVPNSIDTYEEERENQDSVKNLTLGLRYY
ncbi:hypothetical protein R5R35_011051 [Gryllus longicercus]|uniref:Phosphate/phosphite/phosphonate ABC transporter substrate-binding protein n=1 Tax=Gryllus longicercus TaxID=2509291 RepID=A0AAN9V5C2_9ORTH